MFFYLVPVSSAPENTPELKEMLLPLQTGLMLMCDFWKTPKVGLVARRSNQEEEGTFSPIPWPVVRGAELQVESMTMAVNHAVR